MDDTPTRLLVAERDEQTRAFLLDNLAADGYEPLGAQTEKETRVKFRNHGPALVVLGGLGEDRRPLSLVRAIRSGDAGDDPTVPLIVLGDRPRRSSCCARSRRAATTSWRSRSPTSSSTLAFALASAGHANGGCRGGSWSARLWSTATRA
jgi:hypothetical protein